LGGTLEGKNRLFVGGMFNTRGKWMWHHSVCLGIKRKHTKKTLGRAHKGVVKMGETGGVKLKGGKKGTQKLDKPTYNKKSHGGRGGTN